MPSQGFPPKSPISSPSFSQPLASGHVLQHKLFLAWRETRHQLSRLRSHLLDTIYITSASFGSFLGHIRIRLATRPPSVDCGQAFQLTPDGNYQEDIRTIARSKYIKQILAIYPWAETVDLQIFLHGFDAGEHWTSYSKDIYVNTFPENAWLLSAKQDIDQAIKLLRGQISCEIPAAIAGVTGKD